MKKGEGRKGDTDDYKEWAAPVQICTPAVQNVAIETQHLLYVVVWLWKLTFFFQAISEFFKLKN